MVHAHFDFETKSEVDLTKVGADVYSQHISTDVLCLAYAFNDESVELWTPGMPTPDRLLNHVQENGICIGHNIGNFEMLIWNNVCAIKYGWPELRIEQCEDTMAMAYAMSFPGSLEGASLAAGINYQKDMKGHRIMLQLSQPRKIINNKLQWWTKEEVPEKYQALYSYCMQDVEVERALYKRLSRLSPYEMDVWRKDFLINRRGVSIDMDSAKSAIEIVEFEKNRLNTLLNKLTNGAVSMCTATGQLTDWLKSKGLDVPSVAKADVVEMLSRPDLPDECRQALLLRQEAAKTSTAKLQAMLKGVGANKRMRGMFQYHGASTGRWAGRRVQLQNLPRPSLPQDKIDEIFNILNLKESTEIKAKVMTQEIGAPLSSISDAIRGFIKAKEGHDFIACDFSAIEARVIAWLSGEEKVLEVFRGDGKIYELTAAGIYKCDIKDIKKDDPRRQVGKVAVLALGYQGGVGALQSMCKAYNLKLAPTLEVLLSRASEYHLEKTGYLYESRGKKMEIDRQEFIASDLIKQFWREANSKIVNYWRDLEYAAISAVTNGGIKFKAGAKEREITFLKKGSFLWCRLPSGRVLCYPYPTIETINGDKSTVSYMTVDSITKKWERRTSYGGLLSENITQAVARDLLASAILELENKNYSVVMHVHDEVICEVKKGFGSLEEVRSILSTLPTWAKDLPLSSEGWRGERFRK